MTIMEMEGGKIIDKKVSFGFNCTGTAYHRAYQFE